MKQRKLYLDIDGVLVVWDAEHNCVELSRGFGRLMRFCRIHDIKPYWLTMWSKQPETLEGINCLLWPKTVPTLAIPEIQPYGDDGKAAAIDYESDFVWIEDGIGENDVATLDAHNARDRFFLADGLDPECLLKFMDFTTKKMGLPEITDWGPNWESSWTQRRKPLPRGDSA